MEMCYDGALVMPSSYAVMDEEEMMYVEGGGKFWDACVWILQVAVGGIIGNVSYNAICKAIAKRAIIKSAMTSAVAAIPWSRVAAGAILAGVVGVTVFVLTH